MQAERPEGIIVQFGGQGLTLVHFSAQPEPFVSLKLQPKHPLNTPWTLSYLTPEYPSKHPLSYKRSTPYPTKGAYVEPKIGQV